jgi:hypothetical protein
MRGNGSEQGSLTAITRGFYKQFLVARKNVQTLELFHNLGNDFFKHAVIPSVMVVSKRRICFWVPP